VRPVSKIGFALLLYFRFFISLSAGAETATNIRTAPSPGRCKPFRKTVMIIKLTFILFCLGLFVHGYSQDKRHEFVVNKSITDSLSNDVKVDTIGQHILGKLFFHINETYSIKDFKVENASDVTFFLEGQKLLKKEFMESVCNCELKQDSLIITGGQGYAGGVAFKIILFDKYCTGQVWLQTVDSVYKLNETDSKLLDEIVLSLNDIEVTIKEKPSFKPNQLIHGKATLSSKSFYQLNKSKELKIISLQFDIEFGCHVE